MKMVSVAWIFDIDGPITNPETKTANPELLDEIIKKMKADEPIAFISGRALDWIEDRVEKPLIARVDDPTLLDNLIISAEFGGFRAWYENGSRKTAVDMTVELPKDVVQQIKDLSQKYSQVMFIDPDKRTMVSIEMADSVALSDFKQSQLLLDQELQTILEVANVSDIFEVHSDTIATNVRHKDSNKRHATLTVIDWIKNREYNPEVYIAFGDSISDIEIKDELDSQSLPNKFVFVGEKDTLERSAGIIFTNAKYDEGTLEYLKNH